jgi:hypothetical protein
VSLTLWARFQSTVRCVAHDPGRQLKRCVRLAIPTCLIRSVGWLSSGAAECRPHVTPFPINVVTVTPAERCVGTSMDLISMPMLCLYGASRTPRHILISVASVASAASAIETLRSCRKPRSLLKPCVQETPTFQDWSSVQWKPHARNQSWPLEARSTISMLSMS